ncbi:hypothetical protein ACEPPN_003804 [Leptodophora sp. 'Broadleaf-Isolate-01']
MVMTPRLAAVEQLTTALSSVHLRNLDNTSSPSDPHMLKSSVPPKLPPELWDKVFCLLDLSDIKSV